MRHRSRTGPYVAPPLLNFFRKSGLNTSLGQFLDSQGAGQCVELASQVASGLRPWRRPVAVPFGDMTPNLTTGTSSYNGLSVNLKKSFSSKFEGLVSYTWSHAIDDSTDVVSTSDAPQNNFAPNVERARSTFDQRHRLVLSGVYNSGRGQSGSPIHVRRLSLASPSRPSSKSPPAVPFNILTGTDTNFDFNPLTDRPNAVAPGSAHHELRHRSRRLEVLALPEPSTCPAT